MTTSPTSGSNGPHASLASDNPQEQFLARLLDRLWEKYRARVPYVRTYEEVVKKHGGTFVNDHIAFRTLACQSPALGIMTVSRVFQALGYRAGGNYHFEDKHLSAIHYQHPNGKFPKVFISELKTWELPSAAREIIAQTAVTHRRTIADELLAGLHALGTNSSHAKDPWNDVLDTLVHRFESLPWTVPRAEDVEALNRESQYGAWVLVHGYKVNHFTSLVNSHGVAELDSLDKTIAALQAAGVPMKVEIEGEAGSKLRQSATEAAMEEVAINRGGELGKLNWSYAYFELAERNAVIDHATGKSVRFEGFLGPQATNLFEMTRLK